MNHIEDAKRLVTERFPEAVAAMLGGSSANGGTTASSDLDIVVIVPGPPAPYRETLMYDGRLVELFVHTVESARTFVDREVTARRSPLLQMCGASVLLVGHDDVGTQLRGDARRLIAAGPPALSARERDDRRYLITTLVEDLLDAVDDEEVAFTGAAIGASTRPKERSSSRVPCCGLSLRLADVSPKDTYAAEVAGKSGLSDQ
ncbi:MAG TPA: nucleotidyltransferase domain-containing protein [Pseudonocardia sp.]